MKRKITLLASLFLLACTTLFAQMSDPQVIQEAKRLQESGRSQQQIFQDLSRKGVTMEQFQRIRAQMNSQSSGTTLQLKLLFNKGQG